MTVTTHEPGTEHAILLRTKLFAPAVSAASVRRLALLARLSSDPGRRLAVLSAPAGWGKSTLLAQWRDLERTSKAFAWLTLDGDDNDRVRFWSYVIASIRETLPGIGDDALAVVLGGGPRAAQDAAVVLVNELAASAAEVVVVLDDYHVIRNGDVHDDVMFLVDRLPPSVRLVLSGRVDPPLPLARLRARERVVELRAHDLRFDAAEADDLLNRAQGLALSPEAVQTLHRKTEGWAAALVFAALALRGDGDREAIVERFGGDDRHVVDYVFTEVLANLPEDVRRFLLRTSILHRLQGSLCDAVTGQESGAATIDRLERENVFVIPLDNRREWYRYHHLFAELLRSELLAAEPEIVHELHERAAAWFVERSMIVEAINHLVVAGSFDAAAELVAQRAMAMLQVGLQESVASILESLPLDVVAGDARLCLVAAWTAAVRSDPRESERWLLAAEAADVKGPWFSGETTHAAELSVNRAGIALLRGDVLRAREEGENALGTCIEGSWAHALAAGMVGMASFWLGDGDVAEQRLLEAAELSRRRDIWLMEVDALGHLSLLYSDQGRLEEARRLAERAMGRAAAVGLREHWVATMAHATRSAIAAAADDSSTAVREAECALARARRGANPLTLAAMLTGAACALAAAGDGEAARWRASEALALAKHVRPVATFVPQVSAVALEMTRSRRSPGSLPEPITERERRVLSLLAAGLTQREIGAELYISLNTVKTHVRSLYRKLGVSSRAEALSRGRAWKAI